MSYLTVLLLQSQLGSAPVAALGIPLDGVVCFHPEPLWQRSVLSLLLRQRPLRPECLLGRLCF